MELKCEKKSGALLCRSSSPRLDVGILTGDTINPVKPKRCYSRAPYLARLEELGPGVQMLPELGRLPHDHTCYLDLTCSWVESGPPGIRTTR